MKYITIPSYNAEEEEEQCSKDDEITNEMIKLMSNRLII